MILDYEKSIEEDYDELDLSDYEDPDYVYDEELGEQFYADIKAVLDEIIDESDILKEDFTSARNMRSHFNSHCLGHDDTKRSRRSNVYYDFTDNSQYCEYERKVTNMINNTLNSVGSLYDYDLIMDYLRNLFQGNFVIRFCNSCDLKNSNGVISLSLIAFSSDVTTNYNGGNTIDVCIKTGNGKTITLYPVDANYLQNKFNSILRTYSDCTDIPHFDFNND